MPNQRSLQLMTIASLKRWWAAPLYNSAMQQCNTVHHSTIPIRLLLVLVLIRRIMRISVHLNAFRWRQKTQGNTTLAALSALIFRTEYIHQQNVFMSMRSINAAGHSRRHWPANVCVCACVWLWMHAALLLSIKMIYVTSHRISSPQFIFVTSSKISSKHIYKHINIHAYICRWSATQTFIWISPIWACENVWSSRWPPVHSSLLIVSIYITYMAVCTYIFTLIIT